MSLVGLDAHCLRETDVRVQSNIRPVWVYGKLQSLSLPPVFLKTVKYVFLEKT